jgi:hypothetical protein
MNKPGKDYAKWKKPQVTKGPTLYDSFYLFIYFIYLFIAVLGMEPGASCMLGKHSISEPLSQPV